MKGNFWVTGIVLAFLAVVLYFSEWYKPAIHGSHESLLSFDFPDFRNKEAIESDQSRSRTSTIDASQISPEFEELAPLDRVNYLIDNGYIEHLRDQDSSIKGSAFAASKSITWSELRSRKTKRYLQKVSSSCSEISGQLGSDYPQTKAALYSLSDAINSIIAKQDETRTANEVVNGLEKLDSKVTNTMSSEGVPRDIFIQWSQVSLAPVLKSTKTDVAKKNKTPVFNPQFRLQFLEITKLKNRQAGFSPSKPSKMSFIASLRGEEVRSVKLYRDGRYVAKLPLQADFRNKHLKTVHRRNNQASGLYSFVIEDKHGESYVKEYRFPTSPNESNWRYNNQANFFVLNLPGNGRHSAIDRFYSVGKRSDSGNNWVLASNLFKKPKDKYLVRF